MPSKQSVTTVSISNNPFEDYNANVLAPEQLIQYWCTPFSMGALREYNERRFFVEKMPIVLQGSRGSGKTTILKYFSFPVQCERATNSGISISQQIINDSGIGFYLRCDDSFLNMFVTVFKTMNEDCWENVFKHYIELYLAKNLLVFIDLAKILTEIEETAFMNALALNEIDDRLNMTMINDLLQYVNRELRYINKYKNDALFSRQPFTPVHLWDYYELSGVIMQTLKEVHPEFKNVNVLLLIDEFENLPAELQKQFNNLVKFCKPGMSLRIGRRSENDNIVTSETINTEEYLRKDHDYHLIILEWRDDKDSQHKHLAEIAKKRLQAFEGIKLSTDLSEILGRNEDLNEECKGIINGRTDHLSFILTANSKLKADRILVDKIISIIAYPENPIAESLCALWISRNTNTEDFISFSHEVAEAMHASFEKKEHILKSKFLSDYNNKYRYSLATVICAAYKKEKSFYSFNTLCYLSEGNVRTFINMCKAIISDALFYEKEHFIKTGIISMESQCRALRDFAVSEFNSVCSIIHNGIQVRNLLSGIGNVLNEFAKDNGVRYPETTQFTYQAESLSPNDREVLGVAESWALIKRGEAQKRLSASVKFKGYLYRLNRVFCPIYNISYRTRGGVNVSFTSDDITAMINGKPISKLAKFQKEKVEKTTTQISGNQISMFDGGDSE